MYTQVHRNNGTGGTGIGCLTKDRKSAYPGVLALAELQEAAAAGERPRAGGRVHAAAAGRQLHAIRLLEHGAARTLLFCKQPSTTSNPTKLIDSGRCNLSCTLHAVSKAHMHLLTEQVLTKNSVFLPTTTANGLAMSGTFQNGTSFYVSPCDPLVPQSAKAFPVPATQLVKPAGGAHLWR